MTPALSIVIPTFNRAHTLSKVLAALYEQRGDLGDAEILVVDDGSTDETAAVAQPYADSAELSCRYLHDKNGGPSVARNRGIRAAEGEIVLLLDCDIIPSDDLVATHRAFHAEHPQETHVLRGSVIAVQAPGESVRRAEFHGLARADEYAELPWNSFRSGNISLKRRFLLTCGLFDPDLRTQEDTELGHRLGRHGMRLFHSERAAGLHDHPMGERDFFRYAKTYGQSMAVWQAKVPGLLDDLVRAGIEHRYGLVSWKSSPSRMAKHAVKRVLINRLSVPLLVRWGQRLHARSSRAAETMYRLAYSYYYRRSFREHARLIRDGKVPLRRPVRVYMLVTLLPPEFSGAARQALALARELAGQGIACTLLCFTRRKELRGWSTVSGVPVHRSYAARFNALGKLLLSVKLTALLVRHRDRYDVLHIHGGSFLMNGPTLTARVLRKPSLLKMTGLGNDDPMHLRQCRWSWLKYGLFRLADHVVAPSQALAASYRAAGLDPARLNVVPNGVDRERFSPPRGSRQELRDRLGLPEGRIAVTVGALIPCKRIDVLIRSWAEVSRSIPDAVLVIVGPEAAECREHAVRLRRLAADVGVSERVIFAGYAERPEEYLQAADAFLFASEREGMPNAVLEAMACGLPCVVRHIPGITDQLIEHGADGLLVRPEDGRGLVEAAVEVLTNMALAQKLGAHARLRVMGEFSLPAAARRYGALYARALGLPDDAVPETDGWPESFPLATPMKAA